MRKLLTGIYLIVLVYLGFSSPLKPVAFPGAEGFGAKATGGRGGQVIYVTNLNTKGYGSLDSALKVPGPAYILFKVNGVIEGIVHLRRGHKTIAGQTSPGGIIVRGLQFASNNDESSSLDSLYRENVIIRHMRSRGADDALRVIHTRDVIIDHCSFAFADDEAAQVSYVSNLTIQNCLFSETNGSHYNYGGMLVNYSNRKYPLDSLSIHHNLFMRIHNRLPECNCNDNVDSIWCQGRNFKFEFSNNLYWDPGFPISYTNVSNYNNKIKFSYSLNSVNNYFNVRPEFPHPMFLGPFLLAEANTKLFLSGNRISLYKDYSDYHLIFCCNDFYKRVGKDHYADQPATRLSTRLPYPHITYTPTDSLRHYMIAKAGNFPRDSMEKRYEHYLVNNIIDSTHRSLSDQVFNDAFILPWTNKTTSAPLPPQDSDNDGMPDYWEDWNGLNKNIQDHNGFELSEFYHQSIEGRYTNLEVYLNRLSDSLVNGEKTTKGNYLGPNARQSHISKPALKKETENLIPPQKVLYFTLLGEKINISEFNNQKTKCMNSAIIIAINSNGKTLRKTLLLSKQ